MPNAAGFMQKIMLKRFSNEQLEKLLLHTAGINSILVDALIHQQDECPSEMDDKAEANLDIVVIDPNGRGERPEKEGLNIDHLCGEWQGGKRKPDLLIFKASAGYFAAFGKQPMQGETGDCYLINRVNGNLCISVDNGYVYLSHDTQSDKLSLYPGGEYIRMEEPKK